MIPQDILLFLQANWPVAGSAVLSGFMAFYAFNSKMKGYQALSSEESIPVINDGATIVDLRSSSEYENTHIAGAVHHTPEAFKAQFDTMDKAQSYLLYCANGTKAGASAAAMKKAGFTDIHVLTLGLNGWRDANLPVNSKAQKKAEKKASNKKKQRKKADAA